MRRDGALEGGASPAEPRRSAWQRHDGAVDRAGDRCGLGNERARFMLALDDDHSEFAALRGDPLLGRGCRGLYGLRPLRSGTVAQALLRAGVRPAHLRPRRPADREARSCRHAAPPKSGLHPDRRAPSSSGSRPPGCALPRPGPARASALVRVCRAGDLERLHDVCSTRHRPAHVPRTRPRALVVRCRRPRRPGTVRPRKVGDLGTDKLVSALRGRWVEAPRPPSFVAPYGEWQRPRHVLPDGGLGRPRSGADRDGWRLPRQRAARAA